MTLRDGGRELRAGGERLISPGALSAACAALEPPSSGASVVGDPAADARWGRGALTRNLKPKISKGYLLDAEGDVSAS